MKNISKSVQVCNVYLILSRGYNWQIKKKNKNGLVI